MGTRYNAKGYICNKKLEIMLAIKQCTQNEIEEKFPFFLNLNKYILSGQEQSI